MTLKEAGAIYNTQIKKLNDVNETLKIFHTMLESTNGPNDAPFTTCIVRRDILQKATTQLEEHANHLNYVLNKEIGVLTNGG